MQMRCTKPFTCRRLSDSHYMVGCDYMFVGKMEPWAAQTQIRSYISVSGHFSTVRDSVHTLKHLDAHLNDNELYLYLWAITMTALFKLVLMQAVLWPCQKPFWIYFNLMSRSGTTPQ